MTEIRLTVTQQTGNILITIANKTRHEYAYEAARNAVIRIERGEHRFGHS